MHHIYIRHCFFRIYISLFLYLNLAQFRSITKSYLLARSFGISPLVLICDCTVLSTNFRRYIIVWEFKEFPIYFFSNLWLYGTVVQMIIFCLSIWFYYVVNIYDWCSTSFILAYVMLGFIKTGFIPLKYCCINTFLYLILAWYNVDRVKWREIKSKF